MVEPTRVYTEGGAVAHLLDGLLSPNQPNSALCGRSPALFTLWLGTGTQAEHERALDLRTCTQCEDVQKERRLGVYLR